MDGMMKHKLRELGFSEKEADVYLALVEIGSAVASDIARKARIKRSTTYVILDALLERGLVSVTERQGVKLYNSTPPEQLIQHLQDTAKRYANMADTAKKLLPELKASRKEQAPTPKIQLFEGVRGIKTVYEDTLSSLEDIRVHAGFQHIVADASGEQYDAGKKGTKAKQDIKVRTVFLNASDDRKRAMPNAAGLKKIMLTSREQGSISSEINIYDDRVVFISPGENFAMVAESRELAEALKKAFAPGGRDAQAKEKSAPRPHTLPGGLAPA